MGSEASLQLPLNSVLWFSKAGKVRLYADLIMYPWDFLNYSQKILQEEVKEKSDFGNGFYRHIQYNRGAMHYRR